MADGTITARFAIDVDQGRQSLSSLGPLAQQVGQQMAGAAGDASAAVDKQMAGYQRLGEQFQFMVRQQASQADVNAQVAPGLTRQAPSASASASVFEDAAREQEAAARAADQLTQRSNALRAALEPLFAAELRRNVALKEADSLLAAGAISECTHAAAVTRAQTAYDHAEAAATKHGKAIGLNTMQVAEFGHVGRAVIDSLAAGASPMQVLAFEGSRVAQALGEGQGGVGGSLKALGALAAAWAPLIAGVAVLGALTFAAYEYAKAQGEARAAVEGFGRASGATATQVMAIADAARDAGEGSASAARAAETALLNTGKVSADALRPATDAVLAFAKATHQEAPAAAQALAGVFSNPGEEAVKLNEKLGFLDQTTLKYIQRLDEQGDRTRAQIVLAEQLKAAFDSTAHHLDGLAGAYQAASIWAGKFAEQAGKAFLAGAGFETRTRDEEIKDLQHRLAAPHAQGDVLADGSIITSSDATAAARLRQLLAERRSSATAQQQAATRQAAQEAADRYNTLVPNDAKRESLSNSRVAAKSDLDAHRISQAQYDAETKAIDKQVAALDKSKEHHDRHAESLARDSASMAVNAAGALASAEAYLQSTQKGQDADAQRQAATTATKRGADLAKAAEEQLALSVAQGAESGAKAVAALRDQTAARDASNAALASGRVGVAQADRDLQNEALLRPLVTLQTRAHGEALRVITEAIDAYRSALEGANDADREAAALKAREASQLQIGAISTQARLSALGPNDPRRGVFVRASALQEGIGQGLQGGALTDHADQAVAKDRASTEADASTYAATTTREYDKQRVLLQAQIAMAGISAGQRALLLADLQKRQELDDHHVDASSEAGQQILAEVRNQELLNQALTRANAGYEEVRGQGERLLDLTGTMFADMDKGWSGMADAALSALKEIESELFKLALINPWKNSLFGENNPTLSSVGGVGGFFSTLFGGGGGFQDPTGSDPFLSSVLASLPGHAQGTDDAKPGYAWVGEKGPELRYLDRGAKIIPHERSMAIAAQAAPATVSAAPAAGGHVVQIYDFRSGTAAPAKVKTQGSTTTVSLYDTAKKGMDSYVKGGDFERAARSTTSNVTKRA